MGGAVDATFELGAAGATPAIALDEGMTAGAAGAADEVTTDIDAVDIAGLEAFLPPESSFASSVNTEEEPGNVTEEIFGADDKSLSEGFAAESTLPSERAD